MSRFEVVVGNIGTVYSGSSYTLAREAFAEYAKQSRDNYGRAANEQVTMLRGGEIEKEYPGR